jgi:hypothetical protein
VLVEKKELGKLRVCIDFRNLNRATSKDEYPMPRADTLINNASGNKIISFLDGNAGYNQIFMDEEDVSKTAFICPGFIGLFEWVVMTFGLKNVGATYQRAMNLIFYELLGNTMEVYIYDIIVKSAEFSSHIANLCKAFDKIRRYVLEMNPRKCAFGVSASKFLAFIIHEHGIEIDPRKCAFGVSFRLYIAAEDKVIGAILTQETEGKEHVVTYLSRRLVDAEMRYTFIEKLCLCLFYACSKCRCYLLSSHFTISSQTDVIKYMFQKPIMSGSIAKWAYALIEYDLAYEPLKSMKGQVIADFIVEHRIKDTYELDISYLTVTPWTLYFDGSVCNEGQGIDIVLVSPSNAYFDFASQLETHCTNNQAEYEALLFGLELLSCMGVKHVKAFGDSHLVVQ